VQALRRERQKEVRRLQWERKHMIGTNTGDSRVQQLLDHLGFKYTIDRDGDFKIVMDTGDGRSQLGFVSSTTYKLASLEIREVWSVGYECDGPIPETVANYLLWQNHQMKLGAWKMIRYDSGRHLAAYAAQIAANTDAETLRTTILAVLVAADDVEKDLSGGDKF
jgi:hypothetical protein